MSNCAVAGLQPYTGSADMPWNEKRLKHLHRRLGFGMRYIDVPEGLNENAEQYINSILTAAQTPSPEGIPFWVDYTWYDFTDFEEMYILASEYAMTWMGKMKYNGIREKMNLFWLNHFVTQFDVYEFGPFLYKYYKLIEQHAFGNFRDFVYDMGLNQAMLLFLNGAQNTRFNPNENYARELFELFTLGVDNGYTETDIQETARALTGYYIEWSTNNVLFETYNFDADEKTIFGQTANFGYAGVINVLFQQRPNEIARFVCEKLYKRFVSPEVDDTIIDELAQTLIYSNWELMPVYQQLFKSEHFFDDQNIGVLVKSPTETLMSFVKSFDLDISGDFPFNPQFTWEEVLYYRVQDMGQSLFNPVDVAGWPGNRNWLNSASLVDRWSLFDGMIWILYETDPEILRQIAIELSGNVNDPMVVASSVANYFLPNGFHNVSSYEGATIAFKWEIPENYFDNGYWDLTWDQVPFQVISLLQYIFRQPEFQLT